MPFDPSAPVVQETSPGVFEVRAYDTPPDQFVPFDAKGQTITYDDLYSMTEQHAAALGLYEALQFQPLPGEVANGEQTYAWGDPNKIYTVFDTFEQLPEDPEKVYQHDTTSRLESGFISKATYLSRLTPPEIEALDTILATPEKPKLDAIFTQEDFAVWRRNYLDYPAFHRFDGISINVTAAAIGDPNRAKDEVLAPDWSLPWNYNPYSPAG